MCGISGAFTIRQDKDWSPLVQKIVESQKRRGPDHQAVEPIEGAVSRSVLGHNRLSIIDLDERSHQPMWDATKRYAIIFNGEIYNYLELSRELALEGSHFRTNSDTEVLLEAFKRWGPDCVTRFNGMFAFAILDTENEELWLYRDRFGVKPCYYFLSETDLLFASTPGVIARNLGLRPNLEYVAQGLRYWFYLDGSSISPYEGLMALPAGHRLHVKAGTGDRLKSRLERYYDFQERATRLRDTFLDDPTEKLIQRVSETLESAVTLRLRADVPIGISLSGGLDSSSVAALLTEQSRRPMGFTLGSPEAKKSEGPLVKELSERLGIEVDYVWPTSDEIVKAFWECLETQGAPFTNATVIAQYMVFKRARERGYKVLLGGQGGDEAFMGYRKFQAFRLRQLVAGGEYAKAAYFLWQLTPLLAAELPSASHYWKHRWRYVRAKGNESTLRLPDCPPLRLGYDGREELWIRQMADIVDLSLPTLLRLEDRNSMGNSIESRLPFLDYRLLELALALPEAIKVREGFGKWVLREVVKGKIPDSIRRARYKKGFNVSEGGWIVSGLGASLREKLHSHGSKINGFMRRNDFTVDKTFSDDELIHRPTAFAEAIALAWLGDRV